MRQLLERGHKVSGLSSHRPEVVAELGAEPVVANAFDRDGLIKAVQNTAPDAVIHVLTRIPNSAYLTPGKLKINDRLRIEGTRNLIEAARAADVSKFLAESISFAFRGRSEDKAKPLERMGGFQRSVDAALNLEEQTREYEGIVLRYGFFYGPGTTYADAIPNAIRRRMLPIVGEGTAWWSFIHVDDAAGATVAALENGKPGETYNVCDDEPILARDALDYLAETIGAHKPMRLPAIAPSYIKAYFNDFTGASNSKARSELAWAPKHPTFRV